MTNTSLVAKKLAIIDLHLQRLRERRPASAAELRSNALVQDAIALGVIVLVQEATDIAFHIASDEKWEVAASYREAFDVLARHQVIDAELATALAGATHLRNRIAHGYASLDVDRLWNELPTGMASFEAFSKAIAAFLLRSA
jgi:uncharacterized protein YutE (UPF0331/DUF86 family)